MITLAVKDIAREIAKIRRMVPDAQGFMKDFIKSNARLLVSNPGRVPGLVQVTPPHSQGKRSTEAKKQGEAAVMADVWRVYGTPGKLYQRLAAAASRRGAAAAFYALAKKRRWEEANEIANRFGFKLEAFDDGYAHERRRNPRTGRTAGRHPEVYVADRRWVLAYIKQKQKNVGMLIAAIVAPSEAEIGKLNGVPSFARRHSITPGRCDFDDTNGVRFVIANFSHHADTELQRRYNYALNYRLKAMPKRLEHIARGIEKKSGLKTS